VLKKIFDPFFTTKAVDKGTGLGLSQVYGFAHQAGGTVSVTSTVGRGTTISLYLPRSMAVAEVVTEKDHPPQAARAHGTILVVEDNPEVADVTATLLEQIGYRVLRAGNAIDALQTIGQGEAIDLVFSDIVMPQGMNGIHLAQQVEKDFPAVRVLLTTGYSDVVEAAETRYPVLRKPFELPALEQAIREAMDGKSPAARRAAGGAVH
jgi:CheY-like chemotaxis protein